MKLSPLSRCRSVTKSSKTILPFCIAVLAALFSPPSVASNDSKEGPPLASPTPQQETQAEWLEMFSSSEFSFQEWLQGLDRFLQGDQNTQAQKQNSKNTVSTETSD